MKSLYFTNEDGDLVFEVQVNLVDRNTNLFTIMTRKFHDPAVERVSIFWEGVSVYRWEIIRWAGANAFKVTEIDSGSKAVWYDPDGTAVKNILSVTPETWTPSAEESSQTFTVSTDADEWTVVNGGPRYCTISVSGDTFTVNAIDNPQSTTRSWELSVQAGNAEPVIIRVLQAGSNITLTVDPQRLDFIGDDSRSQTVQVISNSTALPTISGNTTWMQFAWGGSGNNRTITFSCDPNNSLTSRSAVVTLTLGSVSRQILIVQEAMEYSLVLDYTSPITIAEARFKTIGEDGMQYFAIPFGTLITGAITCNEVISKAPDLTFEDLTIEWIKEGVSCEVVGVRAQHLTITTVRENITLTYRDTYVQRTETSGFFAEVCTELHPLNKDEESTINSTVVQRFTATNVDFDNFNVEFTGTIASTLQIQGVVGREITVVGVGGNTLYQHSITGGGSFEDITVRDQYLSTLSITNVNLSPVKTITLDNVRFLSTAYLDLLVDTILSSGAGAGLTVSFINGSDTPTDEQIEAIKAQGVTVAVS